MVQAIGQAGRNLENHLGHKGQMHGEGADQDGPRPSTEARGPGARLAGFVRHRRSDRVGEKERVEIGLCNSWLAIAQGVVLRLCPGPAAGGLVKQVALQGE